MRDVDVEAYSLLLVGFYCTAPSACGRGVVAMNVCTAVLRSKSQMPILKVNPGAKVEGVLGDFGPLWFGVHWMGNRQHLCCQSDDSICPLCSFGSPRVIGITLCVLTLNNVTRGFLLEISPLAWSNFESRCRFDGVNLADGVRCVISRPRARGALRIEVVGTGGLGTQWLDGERRLLGGWAVLYGLPLPTLTETFEEFQTRVASLVEMRSLLVVPQAAN